MESPLLFNEINTTTFDAYVMAQFRFQYQNNTVYRTFCDHLKKTETQVKDLQDKPYSQVVAPREARPVHIM